MEKDQAPSEPAEVQVKLELEPLKVDAAFFEKFANAYYTKLPHEMV